MAEPGRLPSDFNPTEVGICCRDCGYDLTGTAIGGVCPECGLSARESLEPLVNPAPGVMFGSGAPAGAPAGVNGKAIISVLLGLLSLLICSIGAPFAILMAWHALNDIHKHRSMHKQSSQNASQTLAYLGLIFGCMGMALLALTIAGFGYGLLFF